MRSYETHVGQVVIAWASIEALLDLFIEFDMLFGGEAAGRRPKQPLAGKLDAVRAAIASNALFANCAEPLAAVLARISDRKDDRHNAAHGVVQRFISTAPGGVEVVRYIRGIRHMERVTLTTAELDAMLPAAEAIAQDLIAIFRDLADGLPPHARRNAILTTDATPDAP